MMKTPLDGEAATPDTPDTPRTFKPEADAAPQAEPVIGGNAWGIESHAKPSGFQSPPADQTGSMVRQEGWFDTLRRRASPWIATAADTIVPLTVGAAAVLVFGLLEQARDALFGALGSPVNVPGRSPRLEGLGLFWCYAIAATVFGNLLWYTGRVMATASIRDAVRAPGYARARTHYPRLLAYLLMSLLIAVAVFLARDRVDSRRAALALAGLGLLAPVVLVPLAQPTSKGSRRWAAWAIVITLAAEGLLLALKQPEGSAWQTVVTLAIASTMPTVCYVLWVTRRSWMNIRRPADALLATYGWRLYGFVAACAVIFAALAFAPAWIPRALGSPGIAMIALNGFLIGLVTVCLLLRAVERRLPGLVVVGALAVLAAAALVRLAFHVEPWREVPGQEQVADAPANAPPTPPAALPGKHDIVINAYGGGLRAAFYTAAVLATMDDWSCGAFGARLTALSGVSGGSLGIATYLVARQRVVAAGGWKDCDGKTAVVGALVEDVLRRDHLSPVVARMLTVDLLPFVTPRRGQALLDSWDEAIRTASTPYLRLGPTDGLAMPLTGLTGGIAPVPLVLFNATDAVNGKIFWMSNRGRWGRQADKDGSPLDIRLGQAVLHSARFPLVSPVGRLMVAPNKPVLLVDGGLSDVSGATTLARQVSAPAHWISIDGNFDRTPCDHDVPAAGLKMWSTLNALLALRVNQASLGIERMREQGVPKGEPILAKLDFDRMLAAEKPDAAARCAAIAKLHMAPLGWYMSVRSVEDMKQAIRDAAWNACNQLGGLCRPPPSKI